MKRIFTIALMMVALVGMNAQKTVAYVTKAIDDAKRVDDAATEDNDAVIQMLYDDDNFSLQVFVCDADGSENGVAVDLDGFDVIIGQESFGSGDNVWKDGYPLYIGSLPAPTLYNKMYALRSGKALASGSGKSNDSKGNLEMQIAEGMEEHEIFTGIDEDGDGIFPVVIDSVSDLGLISDNPDDKAYKTIQYNTLNVLSEEGTLLAYPAGVTDEVVIAINDIPEGTDIDGVVFNARVITFDFNFGTLLASDGENLTEEGAMLWKNAIYSLAGLEIVDPANSIGTKNLNNFNVEFLSGQINVDLVKVQKAEVAIYSLSGQLVNQQYVNGSMVTFNTSDLPKGGYVVKVAGEIAQGARTFVVR